MISTAFKINETEVLQCLGQPNETVHSPFSQLYLYLNFSFESDLNKKISQIHIQIWFKPEFEKNSELNQFWIWSSKNNEGMKGLFLSKSYSEKGYNVQGIQIGQFADF